MLLFDATEDPTKEGAGLDYKGIEDFKSQIEAAIGDALSFNKYQEFFLKLEDEAVKTSRSLAGSISGYSKKLEETMFSVFKQTIKIGGSTQDVIDFADQYATTTGRVPPLLEESVVEAVKLSKEFGISTKEIAAMTGQFAQLGLTQSKAIETMRKIGETARKNMVNAATLTKTVQENLKKTASYTFKDGVKGLTEMAAKAQRLGISLESSFSLFDKFMDPDKAIEFASEMQMLGGEFAAQFGDPFSNMGASVEELREKLTKSASSFAEFDTKTGEFKVSREGLKALRLLSEQTGESVENLASVATQSAKEMKIMNEVGFKPEISEDDRKLLSSIAEQKDGEWKVQLPGTEEWIKVSEVNNQNMKNFQTAAQDQKLTADQINTKLLSAAERQVIVLNEIKTSLIRQGGLEEGIKIAQSMNKVTDAVGTFSKNTLETQVMFEQTTKRLKDYQDALINAINTDLPKVITRIVNAENKKIPTEDKDGDGKPDVWAKDLFIPKGGAPKIMAEDTLFQGITGDEVMMGTNLSKGFEMLKEQIKKSKDFAESVLTTYSPNEQFKNIGDPLKNMSNATLQNTLGENSNKLSEVITTNTNTNINTTNTQNLSGGFTVTIDASKVPNSLDPTMLKNEMMKVMYQLNDEMKKQGVLNFKLK